MANLKRLKVGDDSRKNWRTINECLDRIDPLAAGKSTAAAGIAELRPRRKDSSGGGSAGGFKGGWSNSEQYAAGDIVLFTPDGFQAGAYGCALTPPIGTEPDTGAPYWMAFPKQTPSVWG